MSGIPTLVAFQAVGVSSGMLGPIPSCLCFGRDDEGAGVIKLYWDLDCGDDLRDDCIFERLRILDEDRVMDLHEKLAQAEPPHLEHPTIKNVSDGALWIEGYGLTNSCIIVATAKKPTAATSKRSKMAILSKIASDPGVPPLMGWESVEISPLKVGDEPGIELRMLCHCVRLAVIVSSMPEDFGHVSEGMLAIERLLSNFSISPNVVFPR